ncbi:MAG: PIG-L family deacetylase [Candidatus Bathyarchaeia archaeon]|jgi:LmbE family N-acetylglucosaminyl deacetylase
MAHLYVSAHQDDDLIFMSPCLMEDLASGVGVWTVYVMAGDAGLGGLLAGA